MDFVECSFSDVKKETMVKSRSDLISKKLGELLLQGYRMLNATCSKCDCILMQRKNEPVYCVSCQDEELNETPKEESHLNNYVSSAFDDVPPIVKVKQTNGLSNISSESSSNVQGNNSNSFEVLRNKINWATQELTLSNNVKYSIELCEMIKAASEAILALKRTEI